MGRLEERRLNHKLTLSQERSPTFDILRGAFTDIGLVPLASDKYKTTRTAAKDLVTIKLN